MEVEYMDKMNAQTVDEYLNFVPKETKAYVLQIRDYILSLSPDIKERISYGILTYDLWKKRIHLGGYKDHIGLYPGSHVLDQLDDNLKGYRSSKGTMVFKPNQPLPMDLVKEVVYLALGLK
jgi:uncharacterized protein YdhG (YjbR/CyaY superfamily)